MPQVRAIIIVSRTLLAICAVTVAAFWISERSSGPAVAQASKDKRWIAVAPGRVEPRSGQFKVTAVMAGLVDNVLVKPNDKVFAGEPMVHIKDSELLVRLSAAESQVAVRRRARNDGGANNKAEDRRKAEDSVADAEQLAFETQEAFDKAAIQFRTTGDNESTLSAARADLTRVQDELAKRRAQLRKVESGAPLPTGLEGALIAARFDVALTRAAIEKLTVRAPIDGTVLQVNVKLGELAAPSALLPMVTVADLSTLRVRAELDERDISEIKVGQTAAVRAPAFGDREFAGKVVSIAPVVEPARISSRGSDGRTDVDAVEVLIDLDQPGPLAAGMRVDVFFNRATATQ